jgi:hypothetical protein
MSPHEHHAEWSTVNHPPHYTTHPSGIEAIELCQYENFCIGNALKYLLRHQKKGEPIQDLRKAIWYIEREIDRLQNYGD